MNRRYVELDSLRGLAAITVVFSHLALVVPNLNLIRKFDHTPLHIFWAGHEAVILFFVLSGFVLSLPVWANQQISYKDYLIRRICRIYLPYLFAVFTSISLMTLFSRISIPGHSNGWSTPVTFSSILDHIILLKSFYYLNLDGVIWSLIHEMRISLIYPFILFVLVKLNWKKAILIPLLMPVIVVSVYLVLLKTINYNVSTLIWNRSTYILTVHYVSFFVMGALLAKYMHYISLVYTRTNLLLKLTIATLAVIAYSYNYLFNSKNYFLNETLIGDWMIAIGSLVFIVVSLNSNKIKSILLIKPVNFIGKISYSLYLIHIPIIYTLINILLGKIKLELICIVSFLLSIIFASLMHYLIEIPSVRIGKVLTKGSTTISSSTKKVTA